MTDFAMAPSQAVTFENLEWDLTPPESAFVRSGTLDVSSLTQAQHYPNGYVLSGLVLAKNTVTNLLVPYIAAGANGAGTPYGLLRASVPVTRYGNGNRTKIGVACLAHGVVSSSKLPYTSGNAAAGGFIDAAGKTALNLILWEA